MLIRLYGPVEWDTGAEAQRIAAPKRACVLAALADSPGTPVSVVDLIARVWGADPPESAVSTLYSYITRLRAMFRHDSRARVDRLAGQGYVLHVDPESVDVHRVRGLTIRARRHRDAGELAEAVALWRRCGELARGEALVGVGGRWAAEYRAVLRRERLQLLTERYTGELELGHHADAVGELAELVAREPLFEPLIARYLLALYRCGRAAEALDGYEELRVRLRDRSGADPSTELRRLHQAVLRQDPSLDPPSVSASPPPVRVARPAVPAQLPADTAGFHGRDTELAEITARADRGGVVVVDGMAGVGKTALALRAGHRLAPRYPDGQLFVDLHGYAENLEPTSPGTALARILRALDAEVPEEVEERAAALRTALAGRRMLLVLDNARDAEQVRPLLPGTEECLTIVTSRRRLVELVDTRVVSLPTLPPRQAAELFAAEAEVDVDAEVLRIAELCGGLPLAVRIAASRLRHRPGWGPAELARRLTRGHSALRELDGTGRGIAAAFELSYRDLDPVARRQFRLLSVFPGSEFDLEAAATLAGVEPGDAQEVLELLVDAQLLSSVGASRYRMHDLLREYATLLVADSDERDAAWRRLAEYYLAMTHAAVSVAAPKLRALTHIKPTVDRTAPADPVEWLHAELPVLERLSAVAVATGELAIARDLGMLAHGGLVNRYTPDELALRFGVAEHGARASAMLGDLNAQADFSAQLGGIHIDRGDVDAARTALTRALEFWRAAGLPTGESVARNSLARIDMRMGRLAAAVRSFEISATLAESSHRPVTNGAVSRMSAVGALVRLGRIAEARRLWERARDVLAPTGNPFELIRIDYYDGLLVQASGDLEAAAMLFHDAVERLDRLRIPHFTVFAIAALTENHLRRGEYSEAIDNAHRQLDLVGTADLSATFEAEALRHLGIAKTALEEYDDALTDLLAAEQLTRSTGNELELADIARALGDLHRARREFDEARRAYQRALDFYAQDGFPDTETVRRAIASLGS